MNVNVWLCILFVGRATLVSSGEDFSTTIHSRDGLYFDSTLYETTVTPENDADFESTTPTTNKPHRPNVILIIADDLVK